MVNQSQLFIGIDGGTQGMRAVAVNRDGLLVAEAKLSYPGSGSNPEQSPWLWWASLMDCLHDLTFQIRRMSQVDRIAALSVTSTSGTVIPLNQEYKPLHDALMYNDSRSQAEAVLCSQLAKEHDPYHPVKFNSSYGLPKIVWFTRHFPDKVDQVKLWVHAGDFLIGQLCGIWGVTDATNSLKTGYSLVQAKWPEYLLSRLKLPSSWFPRIVSSGTVLGPISTEISQLLGWPRAVKVVAGMTDGCASQVASGAIKPGEWNTTIGTTLVIKGVTLKQLVDPMGRIYNHWHPQGYWMPGGASNTGADWITQDFPNEDLVHLNNEAARLIPTEWLSYPLKQAGERFPFLAPHARGFDALGLDREHLFASRLEGVAFIERLSYELIESLSAEKVGTVFTAGGGSKGDAWLRIRSNVMNKPIVRMKHAEGAVGAAIIAASGVEFGSLSEAGEHMLISENVYEPGHLVDAYEERYGNFIHLLKEKGYW